MIETSVVKELRKITLYHNVCKVGILLNLKCRTILHHLDCGTILNLDCETLLYLDCGTLLNLDFGTLLNLNFRTLLNYKVTFLTLKIHAPKIIHTFPDTSLFYTP